MKLIYIISVYCWIFDFENDMCSINDSFSKHSIHLRYIRTYGEKSFATYFNDITLYFMYLELYIYHWGVLQNTNCIIWCAHNPRAYLSFWLQYCHWGIITRNAFSFEVRVLKFIYFLHNIICDIFYKSIQGCIKVLCISVYW